MNEKTDSKTLETPKLDSNKRRKLIKSNAGVTPLTIPPSPYMKQLGFGTGVNVYLVERFSPIRGCYKSPWAVKKINSKLPPSSEYKERLEEEANILKSLNHPNIIGYRMHTKSQDGSLCLVMELGDQSLANMIEKRSEKDLGPFPATKILKLVSKNREYYVGTECWSAPEVHDGTQITNKTDIFSFGLVIWEMVSLTAPHLDKLDQDSLLIDSPLSDETLEMMALKREEDYQEALGTRPELPDVDFDDSYNKVLEIFYMCTETSPSKRPSAKQITSLFKSEEPQKHSK